MKYDIEIQKTHNLCSPRHTSQIHFHWFVGSQPLQVGSPAPHCCISTSSPTEIWGNGVKLWKKVPQVSTNLWSYTFPNLKLASIELDSHRWPICYWQASSDLTQIKGSWTTRQLEIQLGEICFDSYSDVGISTKLLSQVSCRSPCIWCLSGPWCWQSGRETPWWCSEKWSGTNVTKDGPVIVPPKTSWSLMMLWDLKNDAWKLEELT